MARRDRVFLDTSAIVALRSRRDPNHDRARRAGDMLARDRTPLFTSNYVFAEAYTALLVRVSRHDAIGWGRFMKGSGSVDLVRVDEEVEEDAWAILEAHADKRWSYVDATSFALMAREGCDQAFTFDRNFAQRGLRMLPPDG